MTVLVKGHSPWIQTLNVASSSADRDQNSPQRSPQALKDTPRCFGGTPRRNSSRNDCESHDHAECQNVVSEQRLLFCRRIERQSSRVLKFKAIILNHLQCLVNTWSVTPERAVVGESDCTVFVDDDGGRTVDVF